METNATTREVPQDLLPLAKAARLVPGLGVRCGVHPSTLWRWIQAGLLRCWRVGGRWHVSRADVLATIQEVPRQPAKLGALGKAAATRIRKEEQAKEDRFTEETLKRFGLEGY